MRVEVKIEKYEDIYKIHAINVYGWFDPNKLQHWIRELQVHLAIEQPAVTEISVWAYDADLDKCVFSRTRPLQTEDSIRLSIENYYRSIGVDPEDKSQKTELVEMRYIIMGCLIKLIGYTLQNAAGIYGKNHSTASHSIRYIKNRIDTELAFRKRIIEIAEIIGEPNLINKLCA